MRSATGPTRRSSSTFAMPVMWLALLPMEISEGIVEGKVEGTALGPITGKRKGERCC